MSIEGTEESNDWRRGEGAYNATLKAMELLKKNKCLFGISVCYTRKNDEYVTSDDFIDKMIENGSKFAFYFNYMPVGHGADKELIPTPDQGNICTAGFAKCVTAKRVSRCSLWISRTTANMSAAA